MEEAQDVSSQENGNENEVMDSVGVDSAEGSGEPEEREAEQKDDLPHGFKKRLGMQEKKHQREMRALRDRIEGLQAQMEPRHYSEQGEQDHYSSPGQPNPPSQTEEDRIRHAVRYALGEQDRQKREAEEAEKMAHVHKQYKRLHDDFDKASEKYDDFEDVVMHEETPFTRHMRDAMLLIDNPVDVAYKLAKNKDELSRISKLHPLDQAREVTKLSFALMGGSQKAPGVPSDTRTMGSLKANPAKASSNTPGNSRASDIRARMKAGTFK